MRRSGLAALAVLGLACGRAPKPTTNVLLISLDSVRADFLGVYGARLPHAPGSSPSPNLDRLAAEGVVYTGARSTTSWTLPAHASLFTGVTELEHGVEQDGNALPSGLATLAETLHDAGYRTYGVYSGPYLDARYGFGRGFERYEAAYGPELANAVAETQAAARLVESVDAARDPERARVAVLRRTAAEQALEIASHRDVSSERVTALALDEFERATKDQRPLFLFAHYFDPHFDYVPREAWARRFDPDYTGSLDGRDYFTNPAVAAFDTASPSGRRRVASERDLEHLRALYAGEIGWTDGQLGRLLDELARRGLAEHTLVVVVGDHGDEFFEHDSIGHRQTLYEEVLRVPVLMRFPGRLAAGERRAEPFTLADVRGAILRLLQPEAPPTPAPARIARLVHPEAAQLPYAFDGEPREVEGMRVRVLEGFWSGPIKVLRERERWSTSTRLEPLLAAAFELASRAVSEREDLRWIDLAAHPAEETAAWSRDFADPRAREALELFRAAYAIHAVSRAVPGLAAESSEMLAALRGLGYVGQEARIGVLSSEALRLPPPGEALASSPKQ